MAGWVNSNGTGNGRGAGGRGFTDRRYTSDIVHGGSGSGGGRWRGERSRGRPPSQPHYRYRPVDASQSHVQSPPSSEQPVSSTSTRRTQITRPTSAKDKSPASGTVDPKESDDKASRNAANFECNVCFDMAADPVVTQCGHLFCWECLYQWLHVHSHHRECPVCKGQVADDAIIPIYGRGGSAASVDNAPPRPTGARVESSRQQHQQSGSFHPMVHTDDEEENPFDLPGMVNFGLGANSFREAFMSFVPPSFTDMDMEDQYDSYPFEYDPNDFDEVYDYHHLLGLPVYASAGAGAEASNHSSLHDLINLTDTLVGTATGVYHHQEFGYSGFHSNNQGRRGRRHRARSSADQSSTDAMVMGGSGAFYRDNNSASSNVSAGASSRPNGDWTERRGRSRRNSNSGGGRGVQDSRRQRTNYN